MRSQQATPLFATARASIRQTVGLLGPGKQPVLLGRFDHLRPREALLPLVRLRHPYRVVQLARRGGST